jgi:hypothetical protein
MTTIQEITDCLQRLAAEQGVKLGKAPPESQEWLKRNAHLPSELISVLCHSWPEEFLCFGPYHLDALADISDSEVAKREFGAGFFEIGAAGNGDSLVVRRGPANIDDCEIGLISHEEIWDESLPVESIYEPICRGLMTLLRQAEMEDALPPDYFEAKGRRTRAQQGG